MHQHHIVSRQQSAIRGRAVILSLFLALALPGQSLAASSPFEIAIDDLDQTVGKEPKQKPTTRQPTRKPVRKKAPARTTSAAASREGNYIRYTIRPGDHIYKILTSRFGLSSARAEALIPRVKEINGISNTSGLQIGQTILLPLSVRSTALQQSAEPTTPETPAAQTQTAATTATATIVALPDGEPTALVDTILTALVIPWSRDHAVTITIGANDDPALTINVDRYFEYGGKRYFLDFAGGNPSQTTLLRLLEVAGYRRISLSGTDSVQQTTELILRALHIDSTCQEQSITLTPAAGSPETVRITGYLISRPERPGEQLLLTILPPGTNQSSAPSAAQQQPAPAAP
jgi:hypothetical protein